jgi:hypothetical protein
MSGIVWLIYIVIIVLGIAGFWMMFQKAGEAGWKSIIPIWNTLIILKMVGREWWWIILLIIPIVGFVIWIIVANDLSKSFGRGAGTTVGLIFLPFIFAIILGFGDAEYQGPAGAPAAAV